MYNYQKLLNPNEKIYFFGGMHWITMAPSFLLLLVLTTVGALINGYLSTHVALPQAANTGATTAIWTNVWSWLSYVPWILTGIGVIGVFVAAIRYLSTRVMLTSHRIVIKKNWLRVDIHQLEMSEVFGAHVDQLTFGRIFGYGRVKLDARFVEDAVLPVLARPFDLLKFIHIIRDHHITEKDDKATAIAPEDLPHLQAGPEIESESKLDELPGIKLAQPEHGGQGDLKQTAEDANHVPENEAPSKPEPDPEDEVTYSPDPDFLRNEERSREERLKNNAA